jgi:hypothetical protein
MKITKNIHSGSNVFSENEVVEKNESDYILQLSDLLKGFQ